MNPAPHTKEEIQERIECLEEKMTMDGIDDELFIENTNKEIEELTKWL